MNVFSRSWEVTKSTFSVMLKNKKMFWFAIADGFLSVLAFAPAIFVGIMLAFIDGAPGTLFILSIIFGYFLAYFFTVFFDVAVVYTAKREFSNKHANTGEILGFTFSRLKPIIGWTLINGTIGLVLKGAKGKGRNGQRNAGGGIISNLLGAAWSILTIFVIPNIVYENKGPINAIKDSFATVKRTWGELLVRWFGLGIAESLVLIPGLVLFGLIGFLGFELGITPLLAGAIILFVIYSIVVAVVFTIANQVFDTALYEYVKNGKVPANYKEDTLKNAFKSPRNGFI